MAKNWSIVVPEATENIVDNNSFEENTTGWSASGSNTIARSADVQFHGAYSLKCTYQNSQTLATLAVSGLTAAQTYTVSARLYVPSDWDGGDIQLNASNFTSATITVVQEWDSVDGDNGKWVKLKLRLQISSDGDGNIIMTTDSAPTAGRYVYLDAVQIENKTYDTTFITGEREEFDASGGRVMNLDDDFSFLTGQHENTGLPPLEPLKLEQSLIPGDYLQNIKVLPRTNLLLGGGFEGSTGPELHQLRQALGKALNNRVRKVNEPPQPRLLRYHGADVEKEIGVYYINGLQVGDRLGNLGERIKGLQFYAPDPMWYGVGEKAAVLDTNDSATFRIIAGRIDGVWDNLGPPDASGSYYSVNALAEDDTYLYIGGNFLNFNNISNADGIVRMNKSTGSYSALGTGTSSIVHALAIAPNGNLYVGGNFSTIGGVSASKIAVWNGSTFSALGSGLNADCRSIDVDHDGNVYVGGNFTTAGGASANHIAKWDGSSWSALSTGTNASYVHAVKVSPGNEVYIGGDFTTAGGVTVYYIAKWNGTSFEALDNGLPNVVYSILFSPNGTLYTGGYAATGGVFEWNGTSWRSLAGAPENTYALGYHNNELYAGGYYTASEYTLAVWNGSSWSMPDIILNADYILAILVTADALYVGYDIDTGGSTNHAGSTTVAYSGSDNAYPTISIKRSGGTSAILSSIRNETSGAVLYFDYSLLDGETLTITLKPDVASVISSHFGSVPRAILPGSDTANFFLSPGNQSGAQDNLITCFIAEEGSPTVTAVMYWRDTYFSYD